MFGGPRRQGDQLAADDVLYTCGRDKLMIVYPGERSIERWSLATLQREKTASVPDVHKDPLHWVIMGNNSKGPMMMWSKARRPCLMPNKCSLSR